MLIRQATPALRSLPVPKMLVAPPFVLTLLALLPSALAQDAPTPPPLPTEPSAALAAMLDLPSPAERRRAADALAARSDVTIEQWLAATKSVPLRADQPEVVDDRTRRHRTSLWVMNSQRSGEIFVRLPADFAAKKGPWPLLLVGHETAADGAGALPDWAPLADRFGCILAAPTEPYEAYRNEGWAYEPDARESVLEALRAVRRWYDIDEDRIVLCGVGRGGLMTWDMALRNPDLFSALIPANGSPRLGNAIRENNLRYLEGVAPVVVRALQWGAVDKGMVANTTRAMQLLKSFAARDARVVRTGSLAMGLAAADADWPAVFAARRTVGATLVRSPDLDWSPRPANFGRNHWLEVAEVDPKLFPKSPMPVPASKWNSLDEQGKRDWLDDYQRANTPRLQVTRRAPGQFVATDRGVVKFGLLLTPDMVDAKGDVTVQWVGKTFRKPTKPSAVVLLRDFAERMDRTFVPTIEVAIP